MCVTGCTNPTSPTSSSSATSVIGTCSTALSEILVVDEIGLPFGNQAVTLTVPSGDTVNTTTLADGRICLDLPPGTTIVVHLVETHEGRSGDSTTTPSGRHFLAGGTGP